MRKLSILLIIFIAICANCQDTVSGYTEDGDHWYSLKMNLLTFHINSNEQILSDDVEISATRNEFVKGFLTEENKNIEYLPNKVGIIFPNLIGYLMFNCSVKEISSKNFENLENLQYVGINYNQISFIPLDTFANLPNLKYLFLASNRLEIITAAHFKNLPRLLTLNLDENNLSEIPSDAFNILTELKDISFTDNKLRTLKYEHFKYNSKLENIWLNNNKIESLNSTMFDHMNKLECVNLEDNVCINEFFVTSDFLDMKNKIENSCM